MSRLDVDRARVRAAVPTHFRTPAAFRAWLTIHHSEWTELWVGFYKKTAGRAGITYQEALDEALCFGWIDGIVKSVDAETYMHRFSPRTSTSHWSLVNVRRFGELEAAGRVAPAGRAAFARRTPEHTGQATYEQPVASLTATQTKKLKADARAWAFWEKQPPGYKRGVARWLVSAKREATRERRLDLLIRHCARGERIPQFISPVGKT